VTGLFSYRVVRSTAFDNGVSSVITYEGDTYMVILTAGFGIDDKTDLTAEYLYTRSENFNDNSLDGLPLGLDNRRQGFLFRLSRRISETMDGQLGYGFYTYDEESSGGADDYTAHVISALWGLRF
jgi:outer membrane receptor for monomeric catechols